MATVPPSTCSPLRTTKSQSRPTWHWQPHAWGPTQICPSLALRLDTFYPYMHSTLGKSIGQAFLSRHFSFDLMICIDHRLQCVQFGWCPVWLLPSQMIFSPIIHCMQIRNLSTDRSCTEQFIQRFFQLLFIKHLLALGPQTLMHGPSASPLF